MGTEAPQKTITTNTDNENRLLQILDMETSRINSLDSTIFTIKGWSVTLVSALVGFSFTTTTSGGGIISKGLFWVALISALIFMIIDLHFRAVQLGHVATVRKIRKLLVEFNTNLSNKKEQNIWEVLYVDKYGVRKQDYNRLTRLSRDYLFTIFPYVIVVIGLIYLILL